MRKQAIIGVVGAVAVAGVGIGAVTANTSGLDTWMSGMNHNRIIQVQNEGGVQADSGKVGIAFFSNSSFQVTSPKGIRILVDPRRNDPSGAWGLWYRMDFPKAEVDIGMSTHAHFDHDALGRLEANMLLDRMARNLPVGRRHHHRHRGQVPVRRARPGAMDGGGEAVRRQGERVPRPPTPGTSTTTCTSSRPAACGC